MQCESAERDHNLERVAQLRYGEIPEIEKKIKEAETFKCRREALHLSVKMLLKKKSQRSSLDGLVFRSPE